MSSEIKSVRSSVGPTRVSTGQEAPRGFEVDKIPTPRVLLVPECGVVEDLDGPRDAGISVVGEPNRRRRRVRFGEIGVDIVFLAVPADVTARQPAESGH